MEPYESELKTELIYIPENARERSMMVEVHATVVAVGPEAWKDEKQPRAKPGDRVFVSKYSGHITKGPNDGKTYRLVNGTDVFCLVTAEVANVNA